MVGLPRSNEHPDQRRSDRLACVDCIKGADFSPQKILRGVDVRYAHNVSIPQNGTSSVILMDLLGSVSPPLVSLYTGTKLDILTT